MWGVCLCCSMSKSSVPNCLNSMCRFNIHILNICEGCVCIANSTTLSNTSTPLIDIQDVNIKFSKTVWHHYSWRCCNTNTPLTSIWNVNIKFIHRIQRQLGIYTKLSKCRLLFTFWIFVGVYIHILNICTYKVFCVVTPPRVVCQTVYEFIGQFSTIKLQYCPLEFQPWILNDKTDHCIICKVLISFLISILSHNYVRLACIWYTRAY